MISYLELDGVTRSLGPGVLTIGSGREAGWRIEDRRLERVHAMITVERDGRVLLTRGAEEAWVELNGFPIPGAAAEIKAGDEMRMGDAVFRLAAGTPHAPADERVQYLRDTRRERWYRLGDATAIGRELSCAVLILEPDISRTHAEILRDGDRHVLHPRRGVTMINGHRVLEPTPLAEGDELGVGQTMLRFTTTPPPRGTVAAPVRVSAMTRDAAQMQTSFMSPFAVREESRRREQRRIGAMVAGASVAVALAVLLVSVVTGAYRSTTQPEVAAPVAADSAAQPATLPPPVAMPAQPEPSLPDSVTPIEAGPMSDEPITAGARARPRP